MIITHPQWQRAVGLLLLCFSIGLGPVQAQMKVGQPSGSPDGSSALDVSGGPYRSGSPYRGFAPPKVALVQPSQAAPVDNPVIGLLVFNTASVGDLTPGYYYWEGTQWIRFSTTATTGSARMAAGGGQPIKAFLLADLTTSAFTSPYPDHFILVDAGKEGLFSLDPTDTSTPDNGGTVLVRGGNRYKRKFSGPIDVRWFGAVEVSPTPGVAAPDAAPAIQAAVNYAKSMNHNSGVPYNATVLIPAGYYLINSTIDLTKSHGIWIKGEGGGWLNTIILGATGDRPMFDFSGSNYSGCENIMFYAGNTNSSQIGVQFALTTNGGLNCGIRNCHFNMTDIPTANGGLGSIALLNSRSEEFYIYSCRLSANTPLVLSCNPVVSGMANAQTTVTSVFDPVSVGQGSMGNVSIGGTQLHVINRRQPAMILAGTNSVNFDGYIGRPVKQSGTNETAILCSVANTNLKIRTTIEDFSQILKIASSGFDNGELDIILSQSASPSTELIDMTDSDVVNSRFHINLAGAADRNRTVLYHAPVGNGSQPVDVNRKLLNTDVSCYTLSDPTKIISPNLLKRATNCTFNTSQPFEKKEGGVIRQLGTQTIYLGTVANPITPAIISFKEARTASTGGYYLIRVKGVIKAGTYASADQASRPFTAEIMITQKTSGSETITPLVILGAQSTTNSGYLNITDVAVNASISHPDGVDNPNGVVSVTVLPTIVGAAEEVRFIGSSEVAADFKVNDPIPN